MSKARRTAHEPGAPADVVSIADRLAITDLIHAYAEHIRHGEGWACAALFEVDADYGIYRDATDPSRQPDVALKGRDAIIAYVSNSAGGGRRVLPLITNLIVDVAGDRATARCLNRTVTVPGGDELIGEYRDAFRKRDGLWRFSARRFTVLHVRSA